MALLTALIVVAAACKPVTDQKAGTATAPPDAQRASVMIDSVSYRHDRSMKYTIYDLAQTPPRAIGGAIVGRLATGGEKGCCVGLPKAWRSGLKVRVQWQEGDREQTYPQEYVRDLEIPRYDTPADLFVVFYPEHEVEVVVSAAEPGHPDWRGRVKQTPWEQCLATNERKVCKAALPKLFDTESSKGYCTYVFEEKRPNAEDNCWFAMHECMRDYEDEAFCKGILWGPRRK
jgi:hypothetical protein